MDVGKWIMDDADYESFAFHDNLVHALSYDPDGLSLSLDIDYILKWDEAEEEEGAFSFWVSPATLYFELAIDVEIDIKIANVIDFRIYGIEKRPSAVEGDNETVFHEYEIMLDHIGSIVLQSPGSRLFIRETPLRMESQSLSLVERGGISIERRTPETSPNGEQ